MKRILLVAISFLLVNGINAQCVPDASLTIPGIYPPAGSTNDSSAIILPDAQVGVMSSYVTQIAVLDDTLITFQGVTFNVPVDSLGIIAVNGLPPGMTAACDIPNCTWPGGGNGCIELSGAPSMAGNYDIIADVTTRIVFGTLIDTAVTTPFVFNLTVTPAASIFEVRPIDFRISPVPASDYIDIRINRSSNKAIEYSIIDILGRPVQEGTFLPDGGDHRLTIDQVRNGNYFLILRDDQGVASESLIIAR